MSEEILGSFVIEKPRLLKVNITYRIFLTPERLVAAKFGSVKEAFWSLLGELLGKPSSG